MQGVAVNSSLQDSQYLSIETERLLYQLNSVLYRLEKKHESAQNIEQFTKGVHRGYSKGLKHGL